jgi:hypothetical protein
VKQVGCENEDGTLNIHSEQDTCAVCAPPSREAEIAARLGLTVSFSANHHNAQDMDDLGYLLAQLQQARQELDALKDRLTIDEHGTVTLKDLRR